ncbi:hypothetical protein Pan44_12270 [Caulifigura coniformis]|uniref:Uncharacterized protein n=1 Tax=Caulifigura coniformis TaxID=2527983 RepID=A0A517SAQ7_9PLAN|nr:hypothetical protein Pan44_12270 [Caulifigura coniformis]
MTSPATLPLLNAGAEAVVETRLLKTELQQIH